MSLFGRARRQIRERVAARAVDRDPLSGLTTVQRSVLQSPSRFKALLCGRRAGKTDLVKRDFAAGLVDPAQPEGEDLFVGLTSESAGRNLWRPLEKLNRELHLGLKFDASKMRVTGPNYSVLQVIGSETVRDLEKPRGGGYRRIRLDEVGAMRPSYLSYLVQDVLEPAMMDHADSSLWLCGTPGPVPVGYWHDASTGKLGGWELHRWTARDNPHLGIPYDQFIHDPVTGLLVRRGWTLDHPSFRREYLAEWATDVARLVYRFERSRNVVRKLPELLPGDSWVYVIGLDFGVGDATACVVLAYPRHYGREVYVVHSWHATGLAPSDAAKRIKATVDQWKPELIVGDVGGLGKAYQQEWNKRFPGIEMRAAKKQDKRGTLEIVSDCLYTAVASGMPKERRGLMVLDGPDAGTDELQRQWATLLWDEDREDIAEGQDDDVADAAMYGFKSCPAYANALEPKPTPESVRGTTHHVYPPQRHVPPELQQLARSWRGNRRRR